MSSFSYRAFGPKGDIVAGAVQAPSAREAAQRLGDQGLLAFALDRMPARARRLRRDQLAHGLTSLATLVESGVPLSRAVAVLPKLSSGAWSDIAAEVSGALNSGSPPSRALGGSLPEIPETVLAILEAGEAASDLTGALRRAADSLQRSAEIESALRGALAYPLFLVGTALLSVALIGGWVVPRFGTVLAGLGEDLPWSTSLLLAVSDAARQVAAPGLVALVLSFGGMVTWLRTERGRAATARALLEMPVLGDFRLRLGTTRACLALAGLLRSGLPLSRALEHAAAAAADPELTVRMLRARELVLGGRPLASAIATEQAMTSSAAELIQVGESTGTLADMLARAGSLEGDMLLARSRLLLRFVEPALVLGVGAGVAFVAVALLQAVYSVRPLP